MKANLNVAERIAILRVLPSESNLVTIRLVRDLTSKLALSDAELTEFEVKQEANSMFFNDKGKEPKELEFGEKETDVIKDSLKNADMSGKVNQYLISVFEKFGVA